MTAIIIGGAIVAGVLVLGLALARGSAKGDAAAMDAFLREVNG